MIRLKFLILLIFILQSYLSAQDYTIDASTLHKELKSGHLKMGSPGPAGKEIIINNQYMTLGGDPVIPVMGEFHFSRYPKEQWEDVILKMKANGITIIATYVFWIHHEEIEGQFDWTGNKDLRSFIKLCQDNGLWVYPRLGPWCHGEVRNGGTPDWLLQKKFLVDRSNHPVYQYYVDRLFKEISIQLEGLYYKEGGPVIGIQLENEYRIGTTGDKHILWLKETARKHGIDVPMYTVTGWGNAAVPEDEVIPLFGGYAGEPWATHINRITDNPVFTFQAPINDERIGNENAKKENNKTVDYSRYPYFACELGVGNQLSGHRREVLSRYDGLAIATIKMGSGCNLPGYYVFAGGVNSVGTYTTMEENQIETGYWNDYPDISYDFQAAVKETGELAPSYHQVKKLHYFLNEFGSSLAPMLPAIGKNPVPYTGLEYAVRVIKNSGFLFGSNYYRNQRKPVIKNVQFNIKMEGENLVFPSKGIEIPDSCIFIWPLNMDLNGCLLKYATVQPLSKIDQKDRTDWFFIQNKGVLPEICIDTLAINSLKSTSGKISKKDGKYLVTGIVPGIKNNISIVKRNGVNQRIIILSYEDSDNIWLFRSEKRKHLFISDANLYMKGNQLHVYGYKSDVKLIALSGKLDKETKSEPFGDYNIYSFKQPGKTIDVKIQKSNLFDGAEWIKASVDEITQQNTLWNKIFIKEFSLGNPAAIKSAILYYKEELPGTIRINDIWLNQTPEKDKTARIDITGYLRHGENIIMARFPFVKGDLGFVAKIKVEYFNSDAMEITTNGSWQTMNSYTIPAPWTEMPNLKGPVTMSGKAIPADNSDFNGWAVTIPSNCLDGLKNGYLHINYIGDKGRCRIGNKLISDSYNNGLPWHVQLKSLGTMKEGRELLFELFPLEKNSKIYFEIPLVEEEIGKTQITKILALPEYEFIVNVEK
jgi:hypothetical protein